MLPTESSSDPSNADPLAKSLIPSVPPPPSRTASGMRPMRAAGRLYPADAGELRSGIRAIMPTRTSDVRLRGVIVPHGPLALAGPHAAAALASGALEETLVILAPNHRGVGPKAASWASGSFAIPGAQVPIEERLTNSLRSAAGLVDAPEAFVDDDAIESILPLLLAAQPRASIVPVALHDLSLSSAKRIGLAVAEAIADHGGGVTLIATSDFGHYVDPTGADDVLDRLVPAVAKLDEDALVEALGHLTSVARPTVDVCGADALSVLLFALSASGSAPGVELSRGTSHANVGSGAVVYASLSYAAA